MRIRKFSRGAVASGAVTALWMAVAPCSWSQGDEPIEVRGIPMEEVAPADAAADPLLGSTWETRTEARTLVLFVPGPRGQITDRNGETMALNKVVYQLAINFPFFDEESDERVLSYANRRVELANKILGGNWSVDPAEVLQHYRNRRWLPLPFTGVLMEPEVEQAQPLLGEGLVMHPTYQRIYPRGNTAAHVLGYVGKTRPMPTGPIASGDPLFVEVEGRDGLEKTFNNQLTGKTGTINVLFDTDGTKLTDEMVQRSVQGHNVVTTLDLEWQELAEKILSQKAKRAAFVVVDVHSGEILVLASWPIFNPNDFVPFISQEKFAELQDDPDIPLYARAFRGLYPPASAFKVPVAIAALHSGAIGEESYFDCPSSYYVGNRLFHNWNKSGEGRMNVVDAIKRSCNTWFYQVGNKTGGEYITLIAKRLGFGARTGIPIEGERTGYVPSDEDYIKKWGHPMKGGDLANIAIGQGTLLVSPLQMAQAMAGVAHGISAPRVKLVKQVQDLNNEVLEAFPDERLAPLGISSVTRSLVVRGMIAVVNDGGGTGKSAAHPKIEVAGKTGTGQWGPVEEGRNLAWFAGFLPAKSPLYAFAALYEGDPGQRLSGGGNAAPIVGSFFKEVFEEEEAEVLLARAEAMAKGSMELIEVAEASTSHRERSSSSTTTRTTQPVKPLQLEVPKNEAPKKSLFGRLFNRN